MLKVSVEDPTLELEVDPNNIQWDIQPLGDGHFHIITPDYQSYRATLVEANYKEKSFIINVNGHNYTLAVKDQFDQLADKMGLGNTAAKKNNQVKAPMPGLVLSISAKVGDTVRKGDALLILEAMKMENVIKAAGEGIIKSILVQKGAAVDKNQLLIEFE